MKHYSKLSRLAATCTLLMLTACQSTSVPLAPAPGPHVTSQRLAPKGTGFRTASLVDPFELPFQTTNFPAGASLSFVDGKVETWAKADLVTQSLKLSRNEAGSLVLEVGMSIWPGGPTSYGLGFRLDFGNVILEQNKPLKTAVASGSMRTTSHENVGTTLFHRFLAGEAEMVLRGKTLEVNIKELMSGNQTWDECFNWGTGGVCIPREVGNSAITTGTASFSTEVPVEICDPNANPVVLPSDLDELLNQLNNLNLDAPNALEQLSRLQNQLDRLNEQLGQLGFTTQSFRTLANPETKVQKLLQKREGILQEIVTARSALHSGLQPLDTQLADAVSLVENHYDYRLHKYEGVYRPLSLEQYRQKFDRAERKFYQLTHTRKTPDLLMAGFIPLLEMQLYRLLLDDLHTSQLAATHETDFTNYVYGFERIQGLSEARQLAEMLLRRVERHRNKLGKLQVAMQRSLEKILTRHARQSELTVSELQALLDDVELQAQEAPDDFESSFAASLNPNGFSIQNTGTDFDNALDGASSTVGSGPFELVPAPGMPGPSGGNPLGGLLAASAALAAAVEQFGESLLDLFNLRFRSELPCPEPVPAPTPVPEPSLFPTPSPSPTPCEPDLEFLAEIIARPATALDDSVGKRNPSTSGGKTTTKWKTNGGIQQGLRDFDRVRGNCDEDDRDSEGRILRVARSENPKINVRTTSTDGRPTLDVNVENGDGTETSTKIRYED